MELEKHHMEMTQCRSGRNIVNNSCRFQENGVGTDWKAYTSMTIENQST